MDNGIVGRISEQLNRSLHESCATKNSFVVFVLGIFVLSFSLPAESAENDACDNLEGDERTFCLTMLVCQSLKDEKAQLECIEVASTIMKQQIEAGEESTDDEEIEVAEELDVAETTNAAAVELPEVSSPEDVEIAEDDVEIATETVIREEPAPVRPASIAPLRRGQSRRNEFESVDYSGEPLNADNAFYKVDRKRFSAQIIYLRNVNYDNAFVILANGLAFEIEGIRRARLKVGDTVEALQSQAAAKQHYVFTGRRGASISARRVRCEHYDRSFKTAKRCELVDSQLAKYKVEG